MESRGDAPAGPRGKAAAVRGLPLLLLVFGLALPGSGLAAPVVAATNFDDGRWLRRDAPLEIVLDRAPASAEGRLRVFVGARDVTSLVRVAGHTLRYDGGPFPLESGETEVRLFLVDPGGRWLELDRRPLRVLTRAGLQTAAIDPALDLTFESRIRDSRDALPEDPRNRYPLGSLAGSLNSRLLGFGVELRTSAELVGETQRERALRFYEAGDGAPRVDLSSYRVDLERGGVGLELGHLSYGGHRHLIQGFSSRGMALRVRMNDRLDFSSAWLNGQRIVGWGNLLGLRDAADNTMRASTLGLNVLQGETARVRLELTYANGTLSFEDDFNTGQVRDAETSQGFGVTLDTAFFSDRLRARGGFARSRYDSAEDEQLERGLGVVSVRTTRDSARYAEVELDLLRDFAIDSRRRATLTLFGALERVDPQYKTLGVFTSSDLHQERLGLQADVGGVSLRVAQDRTRDNLDDIPTLLETRTTNLTVDLAVPLPTLFASGGGVATWLPSVSYGLMRTHQRANNRPEKPTSGFDLGSTPNQMNLFHSASLDWWGERFGFGYRFAWALQDNRQPRRESADFRDVTHGLHARLRPTAELDLFLGVDRTLQTLREEDLTRRLRTLSGGLDWQFLPAWSFSASFSDTRETDSHDAMTRRASTLDAELGWAFSLPSPYSGARPARVYLRYSRQVDRLDDGVFLHRSRAKSSSLYLGVSASLF